MKSPYIFLLLFVVACTASKKEQPISTPDEVPGLSDYYQGYFPIGVALSPNSFVNKDTALIKLEFNSITAENVMKMGPIHPEEGRYNWEEADQLVAFAVENNMKVRGHALCWHEQTPDWFFVDADSNLVDKETLLNRLKDHIYTSLLPEVYF